MDQFDKTLSQKLQEEQSFDFREGDWQEVADRLPNQPASLGWVGWAAAAAILLLLGGLGWTAYELKNANETIESLRNQSIAATNTETVVKEVVVEKIDTIYINTNSATPAIAQAIYFPRLQPRSIFTNENQSFNTHDISVTRTATYPRGTFSSFFMPLKRNYETTAVQEENIATAPTALPYNSLNALDIATTVPSTTDTEKSELTLRNPLSFNDVLRPQGFKFGVSAGKSFLPVQNLTRVNSSNVGVKGEVNFLEKISLVAAVDWMQLTYQSTELDQIEQEIPSPSMEDLGERMLNDLVFTTVDQSFTQYKIGLKYGFDNKSNITPYIGLNYLGSSHFDKEFYYFFDVPQGIPVDLELNTNRRRFTSDGFGVDVGVELQSKKWLSFQIEGYYHFVTPQRRSQYYDLVGLRLNALVNRKQ